MTSDPGGKSEKDEPVPRLIGPYEIGGRRILVDTCVGEHKRLAVDILNDLVTGFCKEQGIDCLDLTPTLAVEPARALWVTPFDKHANPRAHRLAAPALAAFVGQHLRR